MSYNQINKHNTADLLCIADCYACEYWKKECEGDIAFMLESEDIEEDFD